VSLFVLSPEIEDRDEVEVATRRSTKRLSTLNDKYFFLLCVRTDAITILFCGKGVIL
jgi:hypothetical protein